jgi:putative membrane protein
MTYDHVTRGCMLVLSLSIAALSGCSKDSNNQPAASQGNEATPGEKTSGDQGSTAGAPSDAQIAQILATVDTGEIEQAQLATSNARQAPVKDFAQHMIDQHTTSKQQSSQLMSQAGITPAPSPISANLEHKATMMRDQLKAMNESGFDAAYMKGQVEQHKEVLTMIDSQLLPAASNAALRQQLMTARTMVANHLAQAQQIEQSLTQMPATRTGG